MTSIPLSGVSRVRLQRALKAKQRAWALLTELEGLGRDPSHQRDVAFDEWAEADAEWRAIILEQWRSRWMERYVPGVTKPLYQNDVSEQAA